jgi:hypothetical protein
VLFIHADDYLLNKDVLSLAKKRILEHPDVDIHAFCLHYIKQGSAERRCPKGFTPRMWFKTGLWHQAVFCKREMISRLGGFDTDFKIAMDYEFFMHAYRDKVSIRLHKQAISAMRDSGVSGKKDRRTLSLRLYEERRIHHRYAANRFLKTMYNFYWPLYIRYKGFIEFRSIGALIQ